MLLSGRLVSLPSARVLYGILVILAVAAFPAPSHAGASLQERGDELIIESTRWKMAVDSRSGAIRRIEDRGAKGTLLRGGADLWVIQRHKEAELKASGCSVNHSWNATTSELTLRFDGPDAAVTVVCLAADEGPAWRAEVRMKRGTMLGWQFPVSLEFDVAGLKEFIFPENLGLAFTRGFFEPGGAGVQRHVLGGAGLQQVAGDRCQMRPVRDEPVSARRGKDAAAWLPQWYLQEIPRWHVTANRCPAGSKHDMSLVETEHGCWLSGYRLDGWGWLFRLGGMLQDNDARPQMASVIATLAGLHQHPPLSGTDVDVPAALAGKSPARWPDSPKRIGIVLSRPTARPGVERKPNPARLLAELGRQHWLREAEIELVTLRDAKDLRAALAEPRRWFAFINLIGEGFPAEDPERAKAMLEAIRDYVRNGGIWWEAGGGYSFYAALVPQEDASFRTANRDFCDFAAIDSAAGRWSLFGIQPPDDIYVPAEAEIAAAGPAAARAGHYRHKFHALGKPGETVRLPLQQMVLGIPHREVLREYGRRNGFTRGLAEKARPEVVEALKRSILLKVSTKHLKESARIAEDLPFPVVFHIAEYLRGGFDKQYPDHLPPNPNVGTPEDLAHLVRTCRQKGHLFMPYTNPTWWCVNPKGPTFERVGDAPLSRDLEGNLYPESYGLATTQGYAICAWHPAVRAANDVTREQFTRQYPVDVLFQDQVGARGHRWDTNPAAPHAGAYLEGIHRIARVDSATVPLGTEDGQDRLINWETIFSGLSWPWLPNRPFNGRVLYEDLWPEGSWRIEPLALFLAHDKVLFYHHDLGGFVRNRLDLSITLAMGYGLSWWTHRTTPSPAERDWIERLCRVQAAVGPHLAGRGLDDFQYLSPRVIRSRWGGLEIVANLSSQPWKLDAATAIAPEGFVARSPEIEAGIFSRRDGKDCESGGLWVIRQVKGDSEWSEGAESQGRE